MKSLFLRLCFLSALLFHFSAFAQQKITASITVTNLTTNGMTFTLNGSTRTFTNSVVNAATQVLTNSDATGSGSKTNLLNQIYSTPFTQVNPTDTGSNTFSLVGNANVAMSVSLSAGYATVSYSTQTVSSVIALQGPVSALPTATARTNVASDIVGGINAVENTNSINQNGTAASQLMGTTNSQTISGIKLITNAASVFWGSISNSPGISGTVLLLTGGLFTGCTITNSPSISGNIGVVKSGYWTNGTLDNPHTTNLVNYGNAISSPGSAIGSQQFGGGVANAVFAIAVGGSATNQYTTVMGDSSVGGGVNSSVYGAGAGVVADFGSAFGSGAAVFAPYGNAIGWNSFVGPGHTNSTAIGAFAQTTGPNQVMIGYPGISTVVQNNLTVQTNLEVNGNATIHGLTTNQTWIGTNTFGANADIAFVQKSVSSLANGNNAAVPIGTNVVIVVSGPSGAFTINGIANGRDGKLIIIKNKTGQTMTIANQSGTDPTAANRIRTGLSGDYSITNNPGIVTLEYDGADSRWDLVSHN